MRRPRDRSPARGTPPPDTPVTARIRPPRRAGPRPEVEPKAHGLLPPGQDAPFPVPLFPGSSARYNYRSGLARDGRGGQPRTSPVVAVSEQHRGGHPGPGPARDPGGAAERAAARGGLGPGLQDRPHHLRVLGKNGLVTTVGERYGQVYFLSPSIESHWTVFESIVKDMKTRGDRRAAK